MNKAIHFHTISENSLDELIDYDYLILGGVSCKLSYIHYNITQLKDICERVRNLYNKKIYLQQPYYLEENWNAFLLVINNFIKNRLIDGIIVNSPGILQYLKGLDVEIIMSRFAIGKRKTTNPYFCHLLLNSEVSALEVFSHDTDLIKEVKKISSIKIWLRNNAALFNSFSNRCFINNYLGKCTYSPELCSKGKYFLNPKDSKGSKLITSGHFVYLEDKQDFLEYTNRNDYDTIVFNSTGFEV